MRAVKRWAIFLGLPVLAYYGAKVLAWIIVLADISFGQMLLAVFLAFLAAGAVNIYRAWRGPTKRELHGSRSDPPRYIGPRWIERGE